MQKNTENLNGLQKRRYLLRYEQVYFQVHISLTFSCLVTLVQLRNRF